VKKKKPENKNNHTLPGYSLLYVLFLLTMLAMILAGYISLQFFNHRQSLEWMGRAENERNVQSAISLMRDQTYVLPEAQPVTLSLFNRVNDSVTLCRRQWGFFDLLMASARFKNFTFSRIALCGDYHHREKEVALLLGSSYKPLCLCGNTLLKGIFHVPKAGVKAATVAGKFYERKELVDGLIDATDCPLPTIKPRFLRWQPKDILNEYVPFSHMIRLRNGTFSDTLSNSYTEPTVIIYADEEITLERCLLNGNVIVFCDSLIRIKPSAHITDVIIYAKKILIEPEFKGTGQFIATDTLRCGHSCTFPSPSVLAVINQTVNPAPFLFLDKQCHLEGTILAYSANPIKPFSPICNVCEQSQIIGSLYTNCEITLLGEVYGNVITSGFILRNPVAIYQNYLIDAVIDYSRQPDFYVGISYQETGSLLNIIKWLQ
jgi:hypothetical protein